MRVYAGLEVQITSDYAALARYQSQSASGQKGMVVSGEPQMFDQGFAFYEVKVWGTSSAIREDHFVPVADVRPTVENEDLRWRRAADESFRRLHSRGETQ